MTSARRRIARLSALLLAVPTLVGAVAPRAQAGPTSVASTQTISPDADAYVRSGAPAGNYGDRTVLLVDASPQVFESYLRFTVPSTVGTVTGATLRLYAVDPSGNGGTVHLVGGAWTESGITWNTKPALGAAVAAVGAVGQDVWVEVDVTSAVTGPGTYGFAVVTPSSNGSDFVSREGTAGRRPELVVASEPAGGDTTAPSAPSGLSATAVSPTRVDLSWTASTDDTGVDHYVVYRDGLNVLSVPGTTASDQGVSPSTTYTYEVSAVDAAGNESARSGSVQIATPAEPDPGGDPPVVAAAGDVACDPTDPAFNDGLGTLDACHTQATATLLDEIQPDLVLGVGDLQEEHGTLAQYQAVYEPTWGRHRAVTRPVPGNHDYYLDSDARGYFDYWGPAAGQPGRGWYSFDVGTWHVVALNSNCAAVGGCGPGSPQEAWLRADLAASTASCTLAFFHHPRFSSRYGVNESVTGLWQALHDLGVDVAVSGHGHHYERLAPADVAGNADPSAGIRQFVSGTGGQSHHRFRSVLPISEVRNNTAFGVLVLTLQPGAYDWRFEAEAGESFTDSGSAACH